MATKQKRYISFSTVFVGKEKELQELVFSVPNLDTHRELKPNTAATFKAFVDTSSFEKQKEYLAEHTHQVFDAITDIISNANYVVEFVKYTLPLLDGIISDDRKNGKHIINNITQNGDKTIIQALQRLLAQAKLPIIVYEAAAKVLAFILSSLDHRVYGDKQKEFLRYLLTLRDTKQEGQEIRLGDYNFLASLVYMLRVDTLIEPFIKAQGPQMLATFLDTNSGDLQISYYTLMNLWLLSFNQEGILEFAKPELRLITLITDVIQKLSREKLVRVAFNTFRNLCEVSHEAIELMVDAQLIKFIQVLLKGNIKDVDVLEDLKTVGEILEQNLKILSSFEKYQKELYSQHLEWSPVHSEKFWRENINKFQDDDFKLIKRLVSLLDSQRAKNQAIACYDLGEFCRFHPFGRMVLESQQGKSRIMQLAKHEDQAIRENALLALQKIMLHNWNIQVGK